jgi:hypothetical protein
MKRSFVTFRCECGIILYGAAFCSQITFEYILYGLLEWDLRFPAQPADFFGVAVHYGYIGGSDFIGILPYFGVNPCCFYDKPEYFRD